MRLSFLRNFQPCLAELRACTPVIEMRAPAFCEFRDMKHFEELIVFGQT